MGGSLTPSPRAPALSQPPPERRKAQTLLCEILKELRLSPLTLPEIAVELSLSPTLLKRWLPELVAQGLLVTHRRDYSNGGPRAVEYSVAPAWRNDSTRGTS